MTDTSDPDGAIETATRVRVDADMLHAARAAAPGVMVKSDELKHMIEAAMGAAGFEVER